MSNVGSASPSRSRVVSWVMIGVALVAQLAVIYVTISLGLVWAGWLYIVAVIQAISGIAVILWLARRRTLATLAVPVVSALLTGGLLFVGYAAVRLTACSTHERAMFAELASPPGATIELRGEMGVGCIGRFTTTLSATEVIDFYDHEFTTQGWQPRNIEIGTDVAGTKNGVIVWIEYAEGHEGLVIVTVASE